MADAVSVYSSAKSTSGVGSGTGATTFAGLKILGRSIAVNVAPNTQVALDVAGKRVGTVTLNQQSKGTRDGVYRSYTRGIVISLLAGNPFGLPGSTVIYISAAHAGRHDSSAGSSPPMPSSPTPRRWVSPTGP
ncbi:hypothetical protein N803_03540 [Knoellia subterranea KCTC 19937]|uniref:Uncharacterized protein n=1 Tax=Knoellia subterranea KCTC 19937 TaxID=1385521 RepID=A0A0A0JR15_9MICO|nr:hypothetical protein N803_03540 [Knoellia subterranea KCTC 19937]